MDILGKLHGMPHRLVSDHDPLFVSRFWQTEVLNKSTSVLSFMAIRRTGEGTWCGLNGLITHQYMQALRWLHMRSHLVKDLRLSLSTSPEHQMSTPWMTFSPIAKLCLPVCARNSWRHNKPWRTLQIITGTMSASRWVTGCLWNYVLDDRCRTQELPILSWWNGILDHSK